MTWARINSTTFALIEGGLATQPAPADGEFVSEECLGCFWSQDAKAWVDTVDGSESDLDLARALKWQETKTTNELYDTIGLYISAKGTYDGDRNSQDRLEKAAWRALRGLGTWPLNWTMADNTDVSHSAADILAAWDAFCERTTSLHSVSQTLRGSITSATSVTDIEAIDVAAAFAA